MSNCYFNFHFFFCWNSFKSRKNLWKCSFTKINPKESFGVAKVAVSLQRISVMHWIC